MSAPSCTSRGCANRTKDPSGRCHHHRGPARPGGTAVLPSPRLPNTELEQPGYRDTFGVEYSVAVGDALRLHHDRLPDTVIREFANAHGELRPIPTYSRKHLLTERADRHHRTDGPVVVEYWKQPGVQPEIVESFYLDGKPGRTDGGPTRVVRDLHGTVVTECWTSRTNELYRVGGPARIDYTEGVPRAHLYLRSGERSRIDGPAEVEWSVNGEVSYEIYAIDGDEFSDRESFYAYVAGLPADVLAEHFTGTPFEEPSRGHEHEVIELLAAGLTTVEGVHEALGGAPVEWVRSFEQGRS